MADPDLAPAKVILLAVQAATKGGISTLRNLVARHRKVLRPEIVLRILLTNLPESFESSNYVPFLEDLASGEISDDPKEEVDLSILDGLSTAEANKKVRKLHLLPLRWEDAPEDIPEDPLILFLIQRAIRIDQNTGLLNQIPDLLEPFLSHSSYLRTWLISTLVPLIRLNYEYHPSHLQTITIHEFGSLDDRRGIHFLLANTGQDPNIVRDDNEVGRDLRGLVGPWLYGDSRWKRRKIQIESTWRPQTTAPLEQAGIINHKYAGWEEVFAWVTAKATDSWETAVRAIEQWDGPGDVDLGGYEDGTLWLDEEDQRHLEQRYAKAALATAYLVPESSIEALTGVHRIISRIIALLDLDRMPTLEAAAAILTPIPSLEASNYLSSENATHLRSGHLEENNALTTPKEQAIHLLRALLISAFILTRAGESCTIRRAGELSLLQDEHEQKTVFIRLMAAYGNGRQTDDRYYTKMRNEILWLRDWGADELGEGTSASHGRGIFGRLPKDFVEAEILKLFLTNTRYTLARSIYELSPEPPLATERLRSAIFSAAMNAYDNATNANRSRGGVKKCDDILQAFPDTIEGTLQSKELDSLLRVTHELGTYRLVFKQGEPFTPVNLRVHGDPISIIGKVLDQNERAFTQVNDFVRMGKDMVKAGLTVRNANGQSVLDPTNEKVLSEQLSIAEKRIVSMCIDAALAADDFETAYSYAVTRLKDIAGPALGRTPELERGTSGLFAAIPPKVIDDWSWRAALQAGKYRRNSHTVKATHLGNTSSNLEIRHLEQRMDCLAQALRLAPKSTLQEILNAFRRCEEELETQMKNENEEEDMWDAQGDGTKMPGGFAQTPARKSLANTTNTRTHEEAPVSLFDLSRESITRAQSGFSALAGFRLKSKATDKTKDAVPPHMISPTGSPPPGPANPRMATGRESIRKRDQIRNVAVGTLAGGIGWMIGAQPVTNNATSTHGHRDDEEE
ncbi:secretory pathway Sec39 protein [Rutstroemia sp. NJR-2017a BBW]|nr:secretory pathway Sec39 protein [Rutstroemia sp. NJR-2017a BBW]